MKLLDFKYTIDNEVERDTTAIKCIDCGGYAKEDEPTKEEIKQFQTCGRDWACCINAFVCELCGERFVVKLPAPEME